jgi:RNA recognition motif-containing protein
MLPPNSGPPSNNLFVYHLPHSADDALLYKLFSPFGAILQVKVMRDHDGKCKG